MNKASQYPSNQAQDPADPSILLHAVQKMSLAHAEPDDWEALADQDAVPLPPATPQQNDSSYGMHFSILCCCVCCFVRICAAKQSG
jgi:hypothetical protein